MATPRTTLPPYVRSQGVSAVLGPTNTGKTHLAIKRMLAHGSGIIGLPLRLLAREVYNRVVEKAGVNAVALITGEEKIKPASPRYWVCTIEAMPQDVDVAFVAIDEVQLACDLERGHIFTDRILHRRGQFETLLLGAGTMRPIIQQLLPGANIITRPRLSTLSYAGQKKITRLPPRSAIVAFSADEVYAIAELIRRQRGGTAVVLGALSPRTRNAQVELYQSGDVEFLIATDAIGMGLNLDVDHVAFAGSRKFDGFGFRPLNPAEMGQIAGRAGRHLRDGTFGVTGRVDPLDEETVRRIEGHEFDPVRILQWRNRDLDFSSMKALRRSLDERPREAGLTLAPVGEDVQVLDAALGDPVMVGLANSRARVEMLWDACQIPDYRKVSPASHASLCLDVFSYIVQEKRLPDDWFARHVRDSDRIDGGIDTLATRIAHMRTWSFIANRADWLDDPAYWREMTRSLEDKLSDALHQQLTQRFVDRRTSVLMRRLRENAMLEAQINEAGDVLVEGETVGRLQGFQFTPDPTAEAAHGKALRAAASKALAGAITARAERVAEAANEAFLLASNGGIRWQGEEIGRLVAGDGELEPRVRLLADEALGGTHKDWVQARLDAWVRHHVGTLLKPLMDLRAGAGLEGIARGIAFHIVEGLGVVERTRIAEEVKGLDQTARAALRTLGVRFGAYHLFVPAVMKPKPRELAAQLWALRHGGLAPDALQDLSHLALAGRTSIPVNKELPKPAYRVLGYRVLGDRAVRIDILERLADLIRPLITFKPGITPGLPPKGAAEGDGFTVTVEMTSLAGCSGEDFSSILKGLGYRSEQKLAADVDAAIAAAMARAYAEAAPVDGAEAAPEAVEAVAEGVADALAGDAADVVAEPVVDAADEAPVEAAAEGAADAVPAGPVMIEVWRQVRFERREHHRPARRERRDNNAPVQAAEGAAPAAAPEGGAAARQARNLKGFERPRRDKTEGGEQRTERPRREDRPQRDGERRDDRRGGKPPRKEHGGDRGPRTFSSETPKKDKAVDPDSPFAKLMALKAQMEGKD